MSSNYNNNESPVTLGRIMGIIASFMFGVWPVGVYLIIKTIKQMEEYEQTQAKLRREQSRRYSYETNEKYSINQQKRSSAKDATVVKDRPEKTVEPKKGWGMKIKQTLLNIFGGICSIAGLGAFIDMLDYGFYAGEFLAGGLFLGGGLGMLFGANEIRKKLKRFRKYAAIIGNAETMGVADIASKIPTTYDKACKDLEDMIAEGYFGPGAYLDVSASRFMRNADVKVTEPKKETVEEFTGNYKEIIDRIKELNSSIKDEKTSEKISKIQDLTTKIFKVLEEKPEKKNILRTFLNYYLPTTLKLLDDYRRLESQGVSSPTVKKAKNDIENILDTLLLAYEQQLDAMFEEDVLDISSEISALESMMAQDFAINSDPFRQKMNSDGSMEE